MSQRIVTYQDAAVVAVRKFNAPADIDLYTWVEAEKSGETFTSTTFVNENVTILLEHVDISTYGTLRLGWNEQHRLAAFSWSPASP